MKNKFLYPNFILNKYNGELKEKIANASLNLARKLENLDINSLNISDYNKRYFSSYLVNLKGTLQRYTYLLLLCIKESSVSLDKFVFLDYGGGSGILSLLAKELKIGTVIYNDIYDVSCQDALILAKTIANEADYYIHGDIDKVVKELNLNNLQCNAVVSYDVIEHIYNLESFFENLDLVMAKQGKIVMQSTANSLNPIISRNRIKLQKYREYNDRIAQYGHKERDSLKSYFSLRQEIIKSYNNQLEETQINLLAQKTRGLIKKDIITCVDTYIKTGELPRELDHLSNTCDPYTGNWAEHLIKPQYFEKLLNKLNFELTILAGYYSPNHNRILVNFIKNYLNFMIRILQQKNLIISSSYIIYGIKK